MSVPVAEAVERRLLLATFVVNNTNDTGPGSLRQAIQGSNATPGVRDEIRFSITSGTINVASPLPAITDPVRIDTTQDDLSTPTIELNGAAAGPATDGLAIQTSPLPGDVLATAVVGLAINRFSGHGVRITGNGNLLDRCFLGTNATGTAGLGNAGRGVRIEGSDNLVGECAVAFNGSDGIGVVAGTGNDLATNRVYGNGGPAIDLGPDGPTPNDPNDPDTGANNLQNFPVLTAVTTGAAGTTVSGTINTTPFTNIRIAFYANPTSAGEGQTFLGVPLTFTTDGAGNRAFSHTFAPGAVPAGGSVTATATAYTNDAVIGTSEFSAPVSPGAPPRVQQVYVSGSNWTAAYRNSLAAGGEGSAQYGFAVPGGGGGGAQHDELPWNNVNRVSITFTENVSVQAGDLTLTTSNSAAGPVTATAVTYDAATFTATFTLSRSLVNEKVTLNLDGDGPSGVVDTDGDNADGNYLDGEWANPAGNPPAGGRSYPSGDGTAGGDFVFSMRVLPGDFTRDGAVNLADFGRLRSNFNQPNRSVLHGDANGDGLVNLADFGALRAGFGKTTPS